MHRPRKFQGQQQVGETKSLGIASSHLIVIWRSGSWKILKAGAMMRSMAVSHTESFLKKSHQKTQAMPPFRGNRHKKRNLPYKFASSLDSPPKKWVIKNDPELHIPPSSKKNYTSLPTWRRLKAFLKKKNMHNPKATIFDVQQSAVCKSWLVLGNTTLWWHHQRKAFHLNVPYDKTYATRRIQITKLSARFNKDAHHLCFFTLHKLRKRLWSESNYISRIYRSTIIAMFIRIQKKIHIN